MEFFEQQWTSYRAIVDHDLMEHRALTAAVAQVVDQWLAQRPAGAPAPGPIRSHPECVPAAGLQPSSLSMPLMS